MLRFPAAALRAASSFTAALQRPMWAGASQALISVPASVGYQSVVSSMHPSAASSALHAGVARLSSSAAAAALPSATQRLVWVKKEGDADFTMLRTAAEYVSDLKKEVVKEFPSLQAKDLTTLALYVSGKNGQLLNQAPLDSTATLVEALPDKAKVEGKHFLVIKEVAAPASNKRKYADVLFFVPLVSPHRCLH